MQLSGDADAKRLVAEGYTTGRRGCLRDLLRQRAILLFEIVSKIAPQFCALTIKGGLAPFGKIGKANFSYPRLAREIRLDTAFRSCAAMGTYLKYARHRVPSPKPPSERSQNPKTWGNWEGIGDFCLQKCQRGRQLSPLSEATRLWILRQNCFAILRVY